MEEKVYTIEEILNKRGAYVFTAEGESMLPMLVGDVDTLVVQKVTDKLSVYDVALYRRGDKYVLHRVVELVNDGYIMRGDNCYYDEFVTFQEVLGVLTEFYHNGKNVLCTDKKYLRYARRRVKNYPIRRFSMRVRNGFKKVLNIFKKK